MFNALLTVLGAGLQIWASKEKRKYIDKLLKIKKEYREEESKPYENRSDAVLDNLEFELKLLGLAFAADASSPVAPDISNSPGA